MPSKPIYPRPIQEYDGPKVTNTTTFLQKAKFMWGDTFDYSQAKYLSNAEKITIVCPLHGEFYPTAGSHLRGTGCPSCSGNKKKTNKEFITQAKEIHGDKYDYSDVVYVSTNKKVTIRCNLHGTFEQLPKQHLNGHGCKKCWAKTINDHRITKAKNSFIPKAMAVHGEKYDYSKVKYTGSHRKITITCPIHGDFEQTASNHIQGQGCPSCANSNKKAHIIDRAKHGTFYIINIRGRTQSFIKIGITTKSITQRMSRLKKFNYTVLFEHTGQWKDIVKLEETILKTLKDKRFKVHVLKGMDIGGWTECFKPADINILVIEELANQLAPQ